MWPQNRFKPSKCDANIGKYWSGQLANGQAYEFLTLVCDVKSSINKSFLRNFTIMNLKSVGNRKVFHSYWLYIEGDLIDSPSKVIRRFPTNRCFYLAMRAVTMVSELFLFFFCLIKWGRTCFTPIPVPPLPHLHQTHHQWEISNFLINQVINHRSTNHSQQRDICSPYWIFLCKSLYGIGGGILDFFSKMHTKVSRKWCFDYDNFI